MLQNRNLPGRHPMNAKSMSEGLFYQDHIVYPKWWLFDHSLFLDIFCLRDEIYAAPLLPISFHPEQGI